MLAARWGGVQWRSHRHHRLRLAGPDARRAGRSRDQDRDPVREDFVDLGSVSRPGAPSFSAPVPLPLSPFFLEGERY